MQVIQKSVPDVSGHTRGLPLQRNFDTWPCLTRIACVAVALKKTSVCVWLETVVKITRLRQQHSLKKKGVSHHATLPSERVTKHLPSQSMRTRDLRAPQTRRCARVAWRESNGVETKPNPKRVNLSQSANLLCRLPRIKITHIHHNAHTDMKWSVDLHWSFPFGAKDTQSTCEHTEIVCHFLRAARSPVADAHWHW